MILKIIRKNGKKIIYHRVNDWRKKDGVYTILQGDEIYKEMIRKGDKLKIISEMGDEK